jgi:hypothetical protein
MLHVWPGKIVLADGQLSPGGYLIAKQAVVRAARSVTFSDRRPVLKFPAQLAGMPGRRQLTSTRFSQVQGTKFATGYDMTNGSIRVVVVTTVPAVGTGQCQGGADRCYLINRYHVNEASPDPYAADLFDKNADGLQVSLSGPQDQLGMLRSIFAHLKLLGPSPSAWTTAPIS